MRWQATGLRTRGQVQQAWEQAAQGSWESTGTGAGSVVEVMPVSQWQLAFFSNGSWRPTVAAPVEAIRLRLTLPATRSPTGPITLDWLAPQVAGARS